MRYDVVVIGGGAIGTSTFRDLSMRGLEVALIERSRLSEGTTKHSHQNLLGGMRYAVKDPNVAKNCARENRILSEIAPDIVGETEGYFIGFQNDYALLAVKSAKALGVVANELDISEVLIEIPALSKDVDIAYQTEDRNIDATAFCRLNCLSAINHGGSLFEMTMIFDIEKDVEYHILTDNGWVESPLIVNATGPWINSVAGMLDSKIPMTYSQGTVMVQKALSQRSVQFLRPPSDGDAYIVHGDHAWLGTTSTDISHPKYAKPEDWAEEYLKREFSAIIPDVMRQECQAMFAGVRPLPEHDGDGREVTRDYQIIEPLSNFICIMGGKLTTARLIAENVSNLIAKRFGVSKSCMTASKKLPEDQI